LAELTLQNPPEEVAALLRKKRRMELVSTFALCIAGIIGLCVVLTLAVYYKLMLVGPEVLFGSAIGALILFVLVAIFFWVYPKFFLKIDNVIAEKPAAPTGKLLNDPPFEAASVTEHSTELLKRK